jgi:hypothetical protein
MTATSWFPVKRCRPFKVVGLRFGKIPNTRPMDRENLSGCDGLIIESPTHGGRILSAG